MLSIENSGDGGLLIYPVKEGSAELPEKEIEIEYPSKFSNEGLPNEITAAYLLGYDFIRVKGRHRILAKDRERIIFSIKRLIGLEVVEEDAHSITSQFLVDYTVVEPSKIFKRTSNLVRSMISDTLKQFTAGESLQLETIVQRDDEVDRLHFLLVRLIRTAIREARAASKFGLTALDCLDYRVAASSLEAAGDYAVELAESISKLGRMDEGMRTQMETIDYLLDLIQDNATRSFISRDFTLAREVMKEYERVESIFKELREGQSRTWANILHVSDIVERILRCQRDIADLVSPMSPA